MASIYRSRRTTDERSGGKIVRRRRIAAAKTPYDRPIPENAPPQNPNWLTGFIFPTSRMIATSATKLISSIINSDNSSSSSSSASDSSSGILYFINCPVFGLFIFLAFFGARP
ncbi:hypothetical protein Acr_20g0000540 [Actinidia rufa]|uniref:Transmembrane protein n=1 Tax=Actinidia rufa TaxID=165716 RepID=A0A7J0GBQ7_9ERIC|nr:hypothetical protein Acr_20g0000540 [Actinidia rufa]